MVFVAALTLLPQGWRCRYWRKGRISMAERRARQSRRHREEDESADTPDRTEETKPDNQVSAIADDVLDDIDRVLNEQLFDEDEEITPEELEKRMRKMVEGYVQKGGQ
jgi:hypothetical protein